MTSRVVFTGGHWKAVHGKRFHPARIVSNCIDDTMPYDIVLPAGIVYDTDCFLLGNMSLLLPYVSGEVLDRKYLPLFETNTVPPGLSVGISEVRHDLLRYYMQYAIDCGGFSRMPFYYIK